MLEATAPWVGVVAAGAASVVASELAGTAVVKSAAVAVRAAVSGGVAAAAVVAVESHSKSCAAGEIGISEVALMPFSRQASLRASFQVKRLAKSLARGSDPPSLLLVNEARSGKPMK